MRVLLVAALVTLAGCAGDGGDEGPGDDDVDRETFELQRGTGAIAGLLVDDRFRPIHLVDGAPQTEFQATGFVLLQETGEQVRTNENGEFHFVDLDPGTYTLRAQATGHEAVPQRAEVEEGLFSEVSVVARRTASAGSLIVTQEFTAFKDCEATLIVIGTGVPCTLDLSGDTSRGDFSANYTQFEDATYLVTEFLANQDGFYEIRLTPGPSSCSGNYAIEEITDDRYLKIVNEKGVAREENHLTCGNAAWNNTEAFTTVMFVDGFGKQEGLGFGFGVFFAVEGKFLHSLFIGEPEVDIDTYCVLCEGA